MSRSLSGPVIISDCCSVTMAIGKQTSHKCWRIYSYSVYVMCQFVKNEGYSPQRGAGTPPFGQRGAGTPPFGQRGAEFVRLNPE